MLADVHRGGDGGQRGLRDGHRVVDAVPAVDQDDELVAAHPGDQVAVVGHARGQPPADHHQQPVTEVVAEAVVDRLEAVQVEEAHPDPLPGAGGVEHPAQRLEEQRPVGQPGQRVVQRLEAQPLLEFVPLGDVLDHRDGEPGPAVVVPDQRDGQVRPDHAAVLAVVALLHPGRVVLALDQLLVELPHPGGVVGVEQRRHVDLAQLLDRVAEHVGERLVDVDDPAVHAGDADPDRGAGEDRPEPCLAVAQRLLDLVARLPGRPGDPLLLAEGAVAQRAGEPGGQPALHRRDPVGEVRRPVAGGQHPTREGRTERAQRPAPGPAAR